MIKSKLEGLRNHYNRAKSFASRGVRLSDRFKLAILGVARGHPFNSDTALARIGRLFFKQIRVKTKETGDLTVCIGTTDLGQILSFEEIVLERTYPLEKLSFKPDHIYDCGGNIGLFTLQAAAKWTDVKINTFEPNPENIEYLRQQLDVNHLSERVDLHETAVGVSEGDIFFKIECSNTGHIIKNDELKPEDSGEAKVITVKTIDFKNYISKMQSSDRLLLKIDIEGAEEMVLPHIVPSLPKTTTIFLEHHGPISDWAKLNDDLIQVGFTSEVLREREQFRDVYIYRN